MSTLTLVKPKDISCLLLRMVKAASGHGDMEVIEDFTNPPDLRNRKLIFAVELNSSGFSLPMLQLLSKLFERGDKALSGSTGALLVHSSNQLYTKTAAQNIIFLANLLGCSFPGHPVVEATGELENFHTWQKQMGLSLEEICLEQSRTLGERLIQYNPDTIGSPRILALHASHRKTSNTLELWHMVSKGLSKCAITELHVENGEVLDCKGCSYKTCTHYSKQNSCFYGGIMVKDILPALEKADAVVWICPNYNDAVSANLTAVINRLTALYRKTSFYNKSVFAVIVSGNSGSDSVARQLVGALNINKGFRLPPYFSIMAIANDTGEIKKVSGIRDITRQFSHNILKEIKA